MKNSLERSIAIIGESEADTILWAHIAKNYKNGNGVEKIEAKHKRRHFPLGARRWATEEMDKFTTRVKELRATGTTFNNISKTLSHEFGRTRSAIWNKINKIKRAI